MSPKSKASKSTNVAKVGPVKPGTPLYRALEMIAREVAKGLDDRPPPRKRQPEH